MAGGEEARFAAEDGWEALASFSLPSEPGGDRRAMELVAQIVRGRGLSPMLLERLKTAVAEATLNAIEHGNQYRRELPVQVEVWASRHALAVTVTDQGSGPPAGEPGEPDLDRKLAAEQTPRGWGLFLIRSMVDAVTVREERGQHTVELRLSLSEGETARNET